MLFCLVFCLKNINIVRFISLDKNSGKGLLARMNEFICLDILSDV